jgi:hypothetical protein
LRYSAKIRLITAFPPKYKYTLNGFPDDSKLPHVPGLRAIIAVQANRKETSGPYEYAR